MTGQRAPSRAVVAAAMRDRHGKQLQRLVERHATRDAAIVDDACARAWAELVDACDVDLRPPRWSALAWVTRRTMRRAHELVDARIDPARPVRYGVGGARELPALGREWPSTRPPPRSPEPCYTAQCSGPCQEPPSRGSDHKSA